MRVEVRRFRTLQLASSGDLRNGGPLRVVLDPLTQERVLEHIDVLELGLASLQDLLVRATSRLFPRLNGSLRAYLAHSVRKAALREVLVALHEQLDLVLLDNLRVIAELL